MANDDFDIWESDECLGDEGLVAGDISQGIKKVHARRRYESLMEEKRLKQQLDDDLAFW